MTNRQKVVVVGGGIAGKLVARVLSDYFDEVVVLERDPKSIEPLPRKGTRQGEHLHALLHAGQHGLEDLFPGITESFYKSGAIKINSTLDLSWFHHGVWKLMYDGGFTTTLQTRPHLEWHMERYIEKISNITFHYKTSVKNFLYNQEENRIYGVEIENSMDSTTTLTAELVVDTSGASSMTSAWLEKRGIVVPQEKVEIGLSYVSQMFQLPDDPNRDWKIKLIYPNPPEEKIGGTISRIENDRYIVTLIGYLNSISGKDVLKNENEFLKLTKKLPKLDIYQDLQEAIPITQPSVYRVPQIKWRRIDQIQSFPNGLLLMGDAVCRIDPVFGQGMSIAVLEALALKTLLEAKNASLEQVIKTFHKKIAKIIAPIWKMVISEDFRYPEIKGKKPLGLKTQQWYAKQIYLLSSKNQHVYNSFIKVMNLIQPIPFLMRPRTLMYVLKNKFTR